MSNKTVSIRNLILILGSSTSLILVSEKLSVLILFLFLIIISKKIIKTNEAVFYMSVSIGVLVAVFFHWYWEAFYGNSYFLGRKSDDWQYDEFWTKNFIEFYNLNLFKLEDHLNSIESGLGILHNSKGYVALVIILRWISSFFDGYHTLLPRVLNVFVLGYTAYYASSISYYYKKNKEITKIIFLFVFFFPIMLFNAVHVFRDIIVGFLLVFIYHTILSFRFSFLTFIKVCLAMFVLYYFRTSTFFVTVLMILVLYINPKKISLKLGISILMFSLISIALLQNLIFNLVRQLAEYEELNVERFGTIGSRIFALPLYLGAVPRIIYLIFTPVPNFSGFHQLYQSISAFLQIFFFPYLFVGVLKKGIIDFKLKIVFLLFFFGVAFSTATFRHVTMYLPLGIIITTLTYFEFKFSNYGLKNYLGYLLLLILAFGFSIGLAFTF